MRKNNNRLVAREPDKKSGKEIILMRLRSKIRANVMSARSVKEILQLKYHHLNEWEKRGVRLGVRYGMSNRSWRMFSIKDMIRLAILKRLRDIGIPLGRARVLIEGLQEDEFTEGILKGLSRGQCVWLFIDSRGCEIKIGTTISDIFQIEDHLDASSTDVIAISLTHTLLSVLSRLSRSDFAVIVDEEGKKVSYFMEGKKIDLQELVSNNMFEGTKGVTGMNTC